MTLDDSPIQLFPLLGLALFWLLVAIRMVWVQIGRWWRRWRLGRLAETLNSTFNPTPTTLPSADPNALQEILPGRQMQTLRNLLTHEWSEVAFYLFDYVYKPSGRRYSTAEQTVLVVDLDFDEVTPPQFIVRPRKRSDRLKARLGYAFVNIPEAHKELRKKFSVLSFEEDHQEVVRLLGDVLPVLMEELDQKRSVVITTGRFIIYTRHQKLMPAQQSHIEDYLTIGRYLLASVASEVGR